MPVGERNNQPTTRLNLETDLLKSLPSADPAVDISPPPDPATGEEDGTTGLGILDPLLLGEEGPLLSDSPSFTPSPSSACPREPRLLSVGVSLSSSSLVGGTVGVATVAWVGDFVTGRGILLLPPDWSEGDGEGGMV